VGLALAVALQGCLLYTGPINEPPTVQIKAPGGTLVRGQTVTIDATARDPDGDPVTFSWLVDQGRCGPAPDPAAPTARSGYPPPFSFQLPAASDRFVCVWVTVTDSHGAASAPASAELTVTDQPPIAVIDVQQPALNGFGRYDLYSSFRLSAAGSIDPSGDAIVAHHWSLASSPPAFPNPATALSACSPTAPQDLVECLNVGAFPGDYVITLAVDDSTTSGAPVQKTLTVDPDHPPCIARTVPAPDASPIVLGPDETETLSVTSIIDDGSPFPGPAHLAPAFTWSLRVDGGTWQDIVGYGEASLTLAAGSYLSGQQVDVRVDVSDGVADHPVATCDPQCSLGCITSLTWTVDYR
jgi:hypothetical protein